MPADPAEAGRWRPTNAHARAVGAGIAGLILAVVFLRANAFVLAVPLVVVATWGEVHRPRRAPLSRVRVDRTTVAEGDPVGVQTAVDRAGADTLVVVPAEDTWWDLARVDVENGVAVYRPHRWGYRDAPAPLVYALSPWFAYGARAARLGSTTVLVTPRPEQFAPRGPMPHPRGLVGLDRSPRRGSGSEFESINAFQPGDRLRLIHWRSSLRTGSLHVRATFADEESHVVIVIDNTTDVGPADAGPLRPTSFDLTLRAAAALANHHLRRGDRVSLRALGGSDQQLPPTMTSRTWIEPVLVWLARCPRTTSMVRRPEALLERVPRAALVIVLSPLLHDDVRDAMVRHVAQRPAIVVDTLPRYLGRGDAAGGPGLAASAEGTAELAWQILRLRRDAVLDRLPEHGVPVVPWVGPASLDTVLRTIARRRTVGAGR